MSTKVVKAENMEIAKTSAKPAAEAKASRNGHNGARAKKSTPLTAKTSLSGHSSSNHNDSNSNSDNKGTENKDTRNTTAATAATTTSTPKEKGSAKQDGSKSPRIPRGTSKTYLELVHEAIVSLKDRSGSSIPAILKFLVSKYPNLEQKDNPANRFKKNVMTALKSGIKAGRFEKLKCSYKVKAEFKKKQAAAAKRKKQQEIKKRMETKKKEQAEEKKINKDPLQAKIERLCNKDPTSDELKKLLSEKKKREEADARKKYVAERLRKRRYPIEDTKLHLEDKEFGVKPPKEVGPRPQLPFFFHLTETDDRKTNRGYAAAASKAENVEQDCRGLVSDMLQVYHFFRGDVHYQGSGKATSGREIVPAFTLKHLVYAVDDILNGTAKRTRMIPPLIVHLFVTCLQILTAPPDENIVEDDSYPRRQLQKDFATHLNGALSPTSWADVCFLYMDALHRHSTTDASVAKNVLQGLPIDTDYLLGLKDEEVELPFTDLPSGYKGYFGQPEGSLARAHSKLDRMDPWLLTAEELMALLRALTDDVLSRKPEISEDISHREEAMYELLKAKRAADSKLRKIRLAYEGPKEPRRVRPTAAGDDNAKTERNSDDKTDEIGKAFEDGNQEDSEKKVEEWKPTATKKQFLAAEKAQQKASDAYEKGVRSLMARTEPVGFDRNFNGVYCFRHDPDVLYVEMVKPSTSPEHNLLGDMLPKKIAWHVITKKSVFDQFVESLDLRGKRERALYEDLVGPQGSHQSLRRFLHDDIKERADAASQLKEKENLKRKLENAKLRCDEEEGRRSGRLAGQAEKELVEIENDINKLEEKMKSGAVKVEYDYHELTGLDLLKSYDKAGSVETRRTREKKVAATVNTFDSMQCSKLYSTGNIDGTGFVGMLVAKMLEIEGTCNELIPWDRTDVTRSTWISDLENLVVAWNSASPSEAGPSDAATQASSSPKQWAGGANVITPMIDVSTSKKKRPSTGETSDAKRAKVEIDSSSQHSSLTVSQAVSKLRGPLLYLERRIFEITGLAMAAKDSHDADDNMSADGEAEDADQKDSKEKRAWKKIIHKMRFEPSKRHTIIREMVVAAIAAARKSQLKAVVSQLRAALLEFHPNAAGACKASALKVLESHGGYEYDDEDDEDEEDATDEAAADNEEPEIPSSLCAEAVIINSSLDGIEDAGHTDWVDAVKSARTLSRIACLVTAFAVRAKEKLNKMQEEQADLLKAVGVWEKEHERHLKNVSKSNAETVAKKPSSYVVSEVWANVSFSDEIVMVKVEPYPWWPAKKCFARDTALRSSLETVGRWLVSLIGENGGLRVVETTMVRPFTGTLVEIEEGLDMSDVTKEIKAQLDDCMAMARRVLRSRSKNGTK